MPSLTASSLADLYLADETAWLEATAEALRRGAVDELDLEHLQEFLTDMAQRDRREVESRLAVLLGHLLKGQAQPEKRTNSWRATIRTQQNELARLLRAGTLRNHADEEYAACWSEARETAALESGLPEAKFPAKPAFSLDDALAFDVKDD